ncbi:MAG: hypothetical protein HZA89_12790 [Verrucomicrobia bacterium]|nr:hypothetical protein [Verrucomicrobiota bacterium]
MINPFKEVNWQPGPAEKRKFAWSLVIGFPVLALVVLLIRRFASGAWHPEPSLWIGGVGGAVGLLLLAVPQIARPFYLLWYGLGCCIGIVVSNVLLTGFYWIVITLFAVVMRWRGRDALRRKFSRNAKSYWLDAERVTDPKRYYSQH